MIEGSLASSESERNSTETFTSSPPFTFTTCHALNPKWLAKIARNDRHVSNLTQRILTVDSSINDETYSPIIGDSKIQQNIINLTLDSDLTCSPPEAQESLSKDERKALLLGLLKQQGYFSLAEKMESHAGYPWDEFEKIRHPILLEQLVDIYLLCRQKNVLPEEMEQIIKFALRLVKPAIFANQSEKYHHDIIHDIANDAKQLLGQLIYLINQDPHKIAKALHTDHYQSALENIKNAFSAKIYGICENLQNTYLAHKATQLQNPEVALQAKLPLEIAKALLTDIGTINVGIIDTLSNIFLSNESQFINHEINLSHTLTLLQRSPQLREEFEKIHSPSTISSKTVIQATLGLPSEQPIDLYATRLTILTAMLSHLRQGEDGSCFATSIAIEMLSSHLVFCFKDLRQILEEGKLTRRFKGVKKDIPFVQKINDENLHKVITFNKKGELIVNNTPTALLWQAPGLLAACQSIGIKNPQRAFKAVIAQLPSIGEKNSHKLETRVMIIKLCQQVSSSSNPAVLDHLYRQACFAFSSQTSQPLLKVWSNAIANMSEVEEGSKIKTAILQSTLDALQFKLGISKVPPSIILERFFLSIQRILREEMHLHYDPSLVNSSEGGFILYAHNQRINNEEAFRSFLSDTLQKIHHSLQKETTSAIEIKQLNHAINLLIPHLQTRQFMGYLLARYYPANRAALREISHNPMAYIRLTHTPWITQAGNDSKELLKIYLESEAPIPIKRLKISNAEEALTNIIEMCKAMAENEKQMYLNNPNKFQPLCILGKHRLPFMPGNASLVKAWQQQGMTKTWVDQFVVHPGRKISETLIDRKIKQNLIQQLEEILPHYMPESKISFALRRIKQIQDGITIKQYRYNVLKICREIHPAVPALANKLARQVDTALYSALDPHSKTILENTAIHFADTNWSSGNQDLHFCFTVNPGTGQLELWAAHANGSHLTALDQDYWLLNQKWEFLTIPQDLIPDDSLICI